MRRLMNIVWGFALMTGMCFMGYAQTSDPTRANLFDNDEPLKVHLELNFKKFIKEKHKDEYIPANLTVFMPDSSAVSGEIRVKARGEFRRRYCQLPPLKLNFKKSKFTAPELSELTTLKLVTTCKYSKSYQQYLFKEYLAYKIFNLLTPMSFRARLIDITYIDSRGKKKTFQQYGFIIEDVDDVAKRNNSIEIEPNTFYPNQTERKRYLLVSIFQYMIGNTDWYVGNMHNIKLLKSKNIAELSPYVIPYDFDYSGVVNAIYAVPNEQLGIEKVTDRLYRGPCFTLEEIEYLLKDFNEKKEEIISLYENSPYLEKYSKREATAFLESFFEIINNPRRIKNEILSTCYN